jgi:hypothetical protein
VFQKNTSHSPLLSTESVASFVLSKGSAKTLSRAAKYEMCLFVSAKQQQPIDPQKK